MKVIFLKDVPPNARAGDVKVIKAGYGRNFLIPQGLAVLATKDALQRAESLRAEADQRRLKEATDWQQVADVLADTPVVIEMRTGPTGRLYGSVTPAQIAEKLSEMTDRTIDRRGIRIESPIRQVGTFTVPVRFFEDVTSEIKIVVETDSEGGEEQPEPDAPDAEDGPAKDSGAEEDDKKE